MLLGGGQAGDMEFEFNVSSILSGHAQDVKFVKWHPIEDYLFSASYDNTIKCWKYDDSVDDWLCSFTMEGHLSSVWQIDFDYSGEYLCSCSEDKAWSIWRIDVKQADFINLGMISMSHIRSIYSISWLSQIQQSEGGAITYKDLIATGGSDNRINIFEIDRESLNLQSKGGS